VEGIIDTLKIARLLPGSSEGVGLGYLFKKYTGSEFADAHDALADAKATAKLLSKLLQIKECGNGREHPRFGG
jgi:DNA polymerase III alpha subunit (gram-positive type)